MASVQAASIAHRSRELACSAYPISKARISALTVEHDDLDIAIDALVKAGTHDDLIVSRLKKRKLQIKDEITGIIAAIDVQRDLVGHPIYDLPQPSSETPSHLDQAWPAAENAIAPTEQVFNCRSDNDLEAAALSEPDAGTIAPKVAGGFRIFDALLLLMLLPVLWMAWSALLASLNQTYAQLYVLSLFAAGVS